MRKVSEVIEKEAEDAVLRLAISDAKAKAGLIADNFGVALLSPYNISDSWISDDGDDSAFPSRGIFMEKCAQGAPCAQISAGKILYTASINVEYKFEK